jgi:hypothetical protein
MLVCDDVILPRQDQGELHAAGRLQAGWQQARVTCERAREQGMPSRRLPVLNFRSTRAGMQIRQAGTVLLLAPKLGRL